MAKKAIRLREDDFDHLEDQFVESFISSYAEGSVYAAEEIFNLLLAASSEVEQDQEFLSFLTNLRRMIGEFEDEVARAV